MKLILKSTHITIVCWLAILTCLIGQFFLYKISIISNIALFVLFLVNILQFSLVKIKYVINIAISLFIVAGYSMIMGNEINLIIRFGLILFFVLSAYLLQLKTKLILKSLYVISFLLGICLIFAEIYLMTLPDSYVSSIRHMLLDRQLGDVYFYHLFYKIQIKGNAILPFVYMLSYAVNIFPNKFMTFSRGIYLLAILIAGNFAYIVGILIFHILIYISRINNYRSLANRIIIGILVVILVGPILLSFVENVLEEKRDVSNATRIEQSIVLMDDLASNPLTLIVGNGIGHTVDVNAKFRDYTGDTYYELQILYFLNQLGCFPFFTFLVVNIFFTLKYIMSSRLRIVYLGYLVYAITNPYVLDTYHVVVILSLVCSQYMISNKIVIWKK